MQRRKIFSTSATARIFLSQRPVQAVRQVKFQRPSARRRSLNVLSLHGVNRCRGACPAQDVTGMAKLSPFGVIHQCSGSLVQIALAWIYVILWASGFIPSRLLLQEMPPLWALVFRLAAAGLILLGIARALGLPLPRGRSEWQAVVLIGLLTNVVYLALVYTALRHLSAGMAAIIASTNPLFLAICAPFFLREPPTIRKTLGMIVGFSGVGIVMGSRIHASSERPVDLLLAIASVLGLVGSAVVFKRARFAPRALVGVTAAQLIAGVIVLIPLAVAVEGPPSFQLTAVAWVSMFYLVFVMSIGASLLWFWLLTHGEATRVSALYFLVPVVGLGLAHVILSERLSIADAVGALIVAVGIALVNLIPGRKFA